MLKKKKKITLGMTKKKKTLGMNRKKKKTKFT